MASKSKATESVAEEVAAVTAPAESEYSAAELADSYKLFNTSREVVVVALRLAGKEWATFPEAKSIIEKFKNKEVK